MDFAYFDLKGDTFNAETAVHGRDELLRITGPYKTDDLNEVAALDAMEGVKRITEQEYDDAGGTQHRAAATAVTVVDDIDQPRPGEYELATVPEDSPLLGLTVKQLDDLGDGVDGFPARGSKADKVAALHAAGVQAGEEV